MLERILNKNGLDLKNTDVEYDFDIDVRQMDFCHHANAPKDANAYIMKAGPAHTENDMFFNIEYTIQYGKLSDGIFKPLGDPIHTDSEHLLISMEIGISF